MSTSGGIVRENDGCSSLLAVIVRTPGEKSRLLKLSLGSEQQAGWLLTSLPQFLTMK